MDIGLQQAMVDRVRFDRDYTLDPLMTRGLQREPAEVRADVDEDAAG